MRKEKQKEIERVEMRMKNEMRQKKTGYSKTHRRGTRWKTGSACLAIMLTLCLIISMSFPAVTMGMDTGTPAEGSVIQNSQNTPQGKDGDITLLNEKEAGQTSAEEKKTGEASSEEKETGKVSSEEKETGETSSEEKETSEASSEEKETGETSSEEKETGETSSEEKETSEASSEEKETGEASSKEKETTEASGEKKETSEASSQETASSEKAAATDKSQEPSVVSLNDTLHYENDSLSVDFHVEGNVSIETEQEENNQADAAEKAEEETKTEPEKTAELQEKEGTKAETADVTKDDLSMKVTALPESQPEYQTVEEYAEQTGGKKGVVSVAALELDLSYQNQTLDLSKCDITAEITPKSPILDAAKGPTKAKKNKEAKSQTDVSLTALQTENGQETELGTVVIEKKTKTAPVLTVAMNSASPVLLLAATKSADPRFTVQYYANLDVVKEDASGPLTVIDTDNGGNNKGGNLPKNEPTATTKKLGLTRDANGKYKVTTEKKLTEVYADQEYLFSKAPGLEYFNILDVEGKENTNYELKQIWVLNDDAEKTSTDAKDWTVYSNPEQINFTNSESAVGNNTILIEQDTVLRLVFDTTEANYTNTANFYDYDITEDTEHTYKEGKAQGINNPRNYSGAGDKFAFGNANTGTGLEGQNWNGNWLNQYNRSDPNNSKSPINAFAGCTFGLVTGLDSNGNIKYASGVDAPKLFNDGTATGKTFYTDGQFVLQFNRNGDTYTLSAVTGEGGLSGLEYFNNPQCGDKVYTNIWTNNFWPMDSKTGSDGKTGQNGNVGTYIGKNGQDDYPLSDDGLAHNNMFGMQYAVQFELTEDYTGPLEYYFFGDDDMWVFLDGRLVCDIGGVHSSVGEYVNLWDYVEKGTPGTHTLSFYYTERGLSGSTCYMQFTLPSVSSATPGQSTGALTVSKAVVGQNADNNRDEFTFTLGLTGSNDTPLTNTYSYVITKDEEQLKTGTISNGKEFKLKADESITIDNLPTGTKYKVEETNVPDGYIVSHEGGIKEGSTAAVAVGKIGIGNTANVTYTNTITPKLPSTGGPGAFRFTFGGITLIALASVMVITGRRRDEHTTA